MEQVHKTYKSIKATELFLLLYLVDKRLKNIFLENSTFLSLCIANRLLMIVRLGILHIDKNVYNPNQNYSLLQFLLSKFKIKFYFNEHSKQKILVSQMRYV